MQIPYHVTEIFDDINDSYWLWSKLTMEIVEEHAPLKTRTVKGHRVPYMNGELRRAINVKNRLKRKYDRVKTSNNWIKYKKQRNLLTKLRKKSINNYIQGKCNTSNSRNNKEFWDILKPLISQKNKNNSGDIILSLDSNTYVEPAVVASKFNDYFINIAKNIGNDDSLCHDDNVFSCITKHETHPSILSIRTLMDSKEDLDGGFQFQNVKSDVIKKYLHGLDAKKAAGYDLLPPKILKLSSDVLSISVCSLINMCINSCSFPDALKCAQISPIHKKDSSLNITNYRPVSVLPSLSKIFEKVLVEQLSDYFEYIFNEKISGFRSKHSCETVLLRMIVVIVRKTMRY